MSILFISDLHLEDTRPDLNRAFLAFSRKHAEQAEALYIMGDLFNVWVGDDDNSASAHLVAHELARLSAKGVNVYLQHGNRDFLIGERYAAACKAELIPDQLVINPYGQPILLMHGDQLCLGDEAYLQFRNMVRDPAVQQDFLQKPREEREMMAADMRKRSNEANRVKAADIMDVTPSAVTESMADHQVDLLIHGHTHRPAVHTLNDQQTRIVLGDWDKDYWFVRLEPDNQFELIKESAALPKPG